MRKNVVSTLCGRLFQGIWCGFAIICKEMGGNSQRKLSKEQDRFELIAETP